MTSLKSSLKKPMAPPATPMHKTPEAKHHNRARVDAINGTPRKTSAHALLATTSSATALYDPTVDGGGSAAKSQSTSKLYENYATLPPYSGMRVAHVPKIVDDFWSSAAPTIGKPAATSSSEEGGDTTLVDGKAWRARLDGMCDRASRMFEARQLVADAKAMLVEQRDTLRDLTDVHLRTRECVANVMTQRLDGGVVRLMQRTAVMAEKQKENAVKKEIAAAAKKKSEAKQLKATTTIVPIISEEQMRAQFSVRGASAERGVQEASSSVLASPPAVMSSVAPLPKPIVPYETSASSVVDGGSQSQALPPEQQQQPSAMDVVGAPSVVVPPKAIVDYEMSTGSVDGGSDVEERDVQMTSSQHASQHHSQQEVVHSANVKLMKEKHD